jgi:hypothetical protein
MPTMVINIPAEIYKQLEAQVRQAGTTPEELTRKLLETALHAPEEPQPQTAREVLQAARSYSSSERYSSTSDHP